MALLAVPICVRSNARSSCQLRSYKGRENSPFCLLMALLLSYFEKLRLKEGVFEANAILNKLIKGIFHLLDIWVELFSE